MAIFCSCVVQYLINKGQNKNYFICLQCSEVKVSRRQATLDWDDDGLLIESVGIYCLQKCKFPTFRISDMWLLFTNCAWIMLKRGKNNSWISGLNLLLLKPTNIRWDSSNKLRPFNLASNHSGKRKNWLTSNVKSKHAKHTTWIEKNT